MRTSYNYVFSVTLIALIFAGFSCKQDELRDLGFPRLNTLYVEMKPDTGAVFKGEILEIPGDCEIIDHGFVWSENKDATSSIEKLSLGETNKTGIFSAMANRAMVEGKKYYFKSFVETSKTTVFGNEIEFVSLGSHAPVITSIYPTSASWKDTIYIRGKYFSNVKYQMFPHFNDFLGELVYCSDTLMKTTVPIDLNVDKSTVTIRYNNVKYSGKEFTLVPNVTITSITSSGSWNSRIKIRGNNLRVSQTVLFNDITSPIKFWSDTLLEADVPNGLNSISSEIFVKIFNYKLKAPQTFNLVPSTIKSVSHTRVTNGTLIQIKGKNFRTQISKILMSTLEVPITTFTDTLLSFKIPSLNSSGTKTFKLNDGLFTYPEYSVEYVLPVTTGLNTQLCTWKDTVTILGTGLDLLPGPVVKVSSSNDSNYGTQVKLVSTGENEIRFIIPESIDYRTLKIFLNSDNQTTKVGEISLRNPEIENITYNKYSRTTYIIVNGKYFHSSSKVQIKSVDFPNMVTLEKVRSSPTEIVCKYPNVPWDTYSLKASNVVGYADMNSNFTEIELLSPYKLFHKATLTYSDDKYIYANGDLLCFDSNSNRMFKFNMNAKIASTVNGSYPNYYNSANFLLNSKIYFCTGTTYPDWGSDNKVYSYNLNDNTWESLQIFPGLSRRNALGFTIGSKGYLLGGFNNSDNLGEIWEFDPANASWTKKQNSLLNSSKPLGVFVYNGNAYIMNNNALWKFNPTNNTLQKVTDSPQSQTYWHYSYEQIFNIDDKAYYYGFDALWEYNITTNLWKKILNGRTEGVQWRYSFKHDGKYYLASKESIYEFDPSKI